MPMLSAPCLVCGRSTRAWRGSRCPEHEAAWLAERRASRPTRWQSSIYGTRAYKRARAQRFAAAGGRCEWIDGGGARCPAPAAEADHEPPLADYPRLGLPVEMAADPRYLRAVCKAHHRTAGARRRAAEPRGTL